MIVLVSLVSKPKFCPVITYKVAYFLQCLSCRWDQNECDKIFGEKRSKMHNPNVHTVQFYIKVTVVRYVKVTVSIYINIPDSEKYLFDEVLFQ